MKLLSATVLSLTLCLGLAACGNDTESFAEAKLVRSVLTDRVGGATPGAATPRLDRATLANILTPVQAVTRESTGQQAIIANVAVNNGVETWSSVDDVTISLRNGVLVATRGFGADLMAADVPSRAGLLALGSTHTRAHTMLNGLDQAVRTLYTCSVTKREPQAIVVVEISYQTTHVVETCSGGDQTFENAYWFDRAQNLRKSRQWVGADVGYLLIEDLRR